MKEIVQTDPFPHFVEENVLDEELIDKMLLNWPHNNFNSEAPEKFVCDILNLKVDDNLKSFWETTRDRVYKKIYDIVIPRFMPWIKSRYGKNCKIFADNVSLLTATEGSQRHATHTHHYHAPHWICTVLIYLDKKSNGHRGTSIQKFYADNFQEEVNFACNVGKWDRHPKLKTIKEVKYKRNRLLAFYDNPICYHCVETNPNSKGDRKILRFHFSAPQSKVKNIYGVEHSEYMTLRKSFDINNPSKKVLKWIKKDIEQLKSPHSKNLLSRLFNLN